MMINPNSRTTILFADASHKRNAGVDNLFEPQTRHAETALSASLAHLI